MLARRPTAHARPVAPATVGGTPRTKRRTRLRVGPVHTAGHGKGGWPHTKVPPRAAVNATTRASDHNNTTVRTHRPLKVGEPATGCGRGVRVCGQVSPARAAHG
ncbi:hypothetical protein GCM10010109_03750 [Actinoplanes campanulatus]|nr:hypothetical protein GCM10010109_03750 [Actinoplanes campanulatus]GID34090.1 hypothetical protein Aca09nite_05960 [Actinoplanes campanulatus]